MNHLSAIVTDYSYESDDAFIDLWGDPVLSVRPGRGIRTINSHPLGEAPGSYVVACDNSRRAALACILCSICWAQVFPI